MSGLTPLRLTIRGLCYEDFGANAPSEMSAVIPFLIRGYFYKPDNPSGLETAKCAVEIAIEQDEAAALRFIEAAV